MSDTNCDNCGRLYASDEEAERGQCAICTMWSYTYLGSMTEDEARMIESDLIAERARTLCPDPE